MAAAVVAAGLMLVAIAWSGRDSGPVAEGELRVEVVRRLPHDGDAFTQGLELVDGDVVESTGRYGESTVRRWDLESGTVSEEVSVPEEFFAEGLTELPDGRLVQLTWKAGVAIVREADSFEEVDRFTYDGEGWGICMDEPSGRLVMSDGSADLTFRDPVTFEVTGSVDVVDGAGAAVDQLNELECVDGRIWANVWQSDTIVAIDPGSGELEATVDASGLLSEAQQADADVLNGIAALPDDEFLITGKLWPEALVVRFVPVEATS